VLDVVATVAFIAPEILLAFIPVVAYELIALTIVLPSAASAAGKGLAHNLVKAVSLIKPGVDVVAFA